MTPSYPLDPILRCPEVEAATGLSRSTLYRLIGEGTFPCQIQLGPRAVGWRQSDIKRWIATRRTIQTRRTTGATRCVRPQNAAADHPKDGEEAAQQAA